METAPLEPSDKMTHALRLTVPTLVLVLGFGTACLFRRPIRSTEVSPAGDHATFTETRRGSAGDLRMEVPGTRAAMPPEGSSAGPHRGSASRDNQGSSRLAEKGGPPRGGASQRRRHRVVDGDSLRSLAARYLGDANRAGEIFQANRKRLAHPDALPIGVELDIPAP